jgi:hypothetical protein
MPPTTAFPEQKYERTLMDRQLGYALLLNEAHKYRSHVDGPTAYTTQIRQWKNLRKEAMTVLPTQPERLEIPLQVVCLFGSDPVLTMSEYGMMLAQLAQKHTMARRLHALAEVQQQHAAQKAAMQRDVGAVDVSAFGDALDSEGELAT